MRERAAGLLGIANKGGNIQIGEEPVGDVARTGTARLIVLAEDAAGHTQRKAKSFASLHETPLVVVDADKESLGAIFGRNSVAMLAVTDIFLAERFLNLLEEPERYAEALRAVQGKAELMKKRKMEKQRRKGPKGRK